LTSALSLGKRRDRNRSALTGTALVRSRMPRVPLGAASHASRRGFSYPPGLRGESSHVLSSATGTANMPVFASRVPQWVCVLWSKHDLARLTLAAGVVENLVLPALLLLALSGSGPRENTAAVSLTNTDGKRWHLNLPFSDTGPCLAGDRVCMNRVDLVHTLAVEFGHGRAFPASGAGVDVAAGSRISAPIPLSLFSRSEVTSNGPISVEATVRPSDGLSNTLLHFVVPREWERGVVHSTPRLLTVVSRPVRPPVRWRGSSC